LLINFPLPDSAGEIPAQPKMKNNNRRNVRQDSRTAGRRKDELD